MRDPILFLVGAAVAGSLAMNAGLVAPGVARGAAASPICPVWPHL